jgi:hypothetical protein
MAMITTAGPRVAHQRAADRRSPADGRAAAAAVVLNVVFPLVTSWSDAVLAVQRGASGGP